MLPTSSVYPWARSYIFLGSFFFLAAQQYKVRRSSARPKQKRGGKCSQLFLAHLYSHGAICQDIFWQFGKIHFLEGQGERGGVDTEWSEDRTQRNKEAQGVEDTLRGRCWPVCNQTGGSEAVGTHYVLHTHISTTFFFFFLPLSCQPSKRIELTPPFWGFPSFTQTTQTDASQTCQLVWVAGRGTAGVLCRGFRQSPLASGTEPRTGIAAKTPNRGFN